MNANSKSATLAQINAGSPYLSHLIEQLPEFTERLGVELSDDILAEICEDLECESDQHRHLRLQKSKAALLIAWADLSGEWDVVKVTAALTRFADACLNAAVNCALRQAAHRNKMILPNPHNASINCGYAILAMGKHGAGELNYSSDIDIIVLYDPETAPLCEGVEPSTFFVKLTREVVALLQDVDENGYVFRVDLRLRPDPRATQIAISLEAAAIYYENQGQNWERAAMIKARAAAGDIAMGEAFLKRLSPYIWRKYLDYAAIADVQSMKRQIHSVKGHSEIAIQGHDLKLGRGGIREIEFFVQTQQLIAGGRNMKLRGNRTLEMLDALAAEKWIAEETASEMKQAYCFLRMLEHRAQMVDDLQTHLVPLKPQAFESYARLSGFENGRVLAVKLERTLQTVQRHYAALFENAGELTSDLGNLVFTGGEDDPATLETLSKMGFGHGSEISATIRGWHFGRYAATRTARARELITELLPSLLKALAQTGDADAAFLAFDVFLKGLPAGIQFFSMIKANPNFLSLIALTLGAAPRLAEQLSKQPRILEAVVDSDFFNTNVAPEKLQKEIAEIIPQTLSRDEAMDRARVFAREKMFKVGARILSDTLSAEDAGRSYSYIAEVIIERLLLVVQTEFQSVHGAVPGFEIAVVAFGKLGSFEMTAGSDLDLMVVYDHSPHAEMSDGAKPLNVGQYFARLTQRLVNALTALTAEGTLYEVDLRLRPSGSKGPVAVGFASFVQYQKEQAWTWEKLALTRARCVGGGAQFKAKLTAAIHQSLCAKRDINATRKDVHDMRTLMLKELKPSGIWDLKRVRGGLIELEFIAQYLQLAYAPDHPTILSTNTHQVLQNANQLGVLSKSHAAQLLEAIGLYQRLTQLLRLCLADSFDANTASRKLIELLCHAARMPDMPSCENLLHETQRDIATIFDHIIGKP